MSKRTGVTQCQHVMRLDNAKICDYVAKWTVTYMSLRDGVIHHRRYCDWHVKIDSERLLQEDTEFDLDVSIEQISVP